MNVTMSVVTMDTPLSSLDYGSLKQILYSNQLIDPEQVIEVLNPKTATHDIAELVANVFCNKDSEYYRDDKVVFTYIRDEIVGKYDNGKWNRLSEWCMVTKELAKYNLDNSGILSRLPIIWLANEEVINYGCDMMRINVDYMYGKVVEAYIKDKKWLNDWRSRMISTWLDKHPTLVCCIPYKWYTYDDYITAIKKDHRAYSCNNERYRTIDASIYGMMVGGYNMIWYIPTDQREIIRSIFCMDGDRQ
jgi:hypothetical protein